MAFAINPRSYTTSVDSIVLAICDDRMFVCFVRFTRGFLAPSFANQKIRYCKA